jgi:hypothetical protein
MAYATGLDADADMARRWIKQRLFGQLQLAWAHRLHGPIRRSAFHYSVPSTDADFAKMLPLPRHLQLPEGSMF